jgi:hypothetical protein
LREIKDRRVAKNKKIMQNIINELIEFTANLTFMLVVIGLTFLVLTFFVECLCAGILLYLLRPLIKQL